jgi:3-oxoacyl-[acyl-carrier-protein] synthase-3
MGVQAARRALIKADLSPSKIDHLIVATATPEQPIPSTACMIQDEIGATKAAAFDVAAGCTGFIYALTIGNALIGSGDCGNVLVIGAETLSRIVDWTDRSSCVLFADGAGAVVLQATDSGTGLISSVLGADGFGRNYLEVSAGGSRLPASHETVDGKLHYVRMNGREIFRFAVDKICKSVRQVVLKAGLTPKDIALIIPHQANRRIIEASARALKIKEEKFFVNIDRYGNTSSASIPIALSEAVEAGKVKRGDYLVLVGFGAGLTWGAVLLRWGESPTVSALETYWDKLKTSPFFREIRHAKRRLDRVKLGDWFDRP